MVRPMEPKTPRLMNHMTHKSVCGASKVAAGIWRVSLDIVSAPTERKSHKEITKGDENW